MAMAAVKDLNDELKRFASQKAFHATVVSFQLVCTLTRREAVLNIKSPHPR